MVESEGSFEVWYRELHPRLVSSLVAAFGDLGLASEAADEAIARAYAQWPKVSQMDSSQGWVYRVAFNIAKRSRRRSAMEARLFGDRRPEPIDGPAGEVWMLVESLPPRQRAAVVLRHIGQLREVEIAEVLGIQRGTVSASLRAAYRTLRADLTEERIELAT